MGSLCQTERAGVQHVLGENSSLLPVSLPRVSRQVSHRRDALLTKVFFQCAPSGQGLTCKSGLASRVWQVSPHNKHYSLKRAPSGSPCVRTLQVVCATSQPHASAWRTSSTLRPRIGIVCPSSNVRGHTETHRRERDHVQHPRGRTTRPRYSVSVDSNSAFSSKTPPMREVVSRNP